MIKWLKGEHIKIKVQGTPETRPSGALEVKIHHLIMTRMRRRIHNARSL